MKIISFFSVLLFSSVAFAQQETDSVYQKCPVSIKDTVTGNNYFLEHRPATVKTYRNKGNFTIVIEQKDQFFTMFFNTRKISEKGKYKITLDGGGKNELRAKYSFRSGESVAFIDVSPGKVETIYDKATKHWRIILTGLVANMGQTRVSYFQAKADFYIK